MEALHFLPHRHYLWHYVASDSNDGTILELLVLGRFAVACAAQGLASMIDMTWSLVNAHQMTWQVHMLENVEPERNSCGSQTQSGNASTFSRAV